MKELEDETDLVPTHQSELFGGESSDFTTGELVGTGIGPIETAEEVEKSRLPRSGGSHEGYVLAIVDGQTDVDEGTNLLISNSISARNALEFDHESGLLSTRTLAPAMTSFRSRLSTT
jgi:hypothetical protein